MRKKRIIIISIVLMLLALIPVQSTLAYFTDRHQYKGEATLDLNWKTEFKEEMKDNDKDLTVKNTGEVDVIVRVKVFCNKELVEYFGPAEEYKDKWNYCEKDGWWYYTEILPVGATTKDLYVNLKGSDKLPEYEFNIIVVHESARVVYVSNTQLQKPEGWEYVPEVTAQ